MKRMNKVKNVITAKIMGGMVAGLAALAGMAPVTAFAQSQEVICTCDENAVREQSTRNVQYAFMIIRSAREQMHM